MSLRNQPYIPLYVQDFLTDEKLMECSASATGIYIRLMCIMHKSDEYGVVLLKQKDKQTSSSIQNFACKLARFMPYQLEEIVAGLTELLESGVIQNGGDKLMQKRMVHDNEISEVRSKAGKKGGLKTQNFAKAKVKANSEYEYEDEIEDESINSNRRRKKFVKPTLEEVEKYFFENGYRPEIGKKAWMGYDTANWFDSKGQQIKNWKQKMINVWFRDEHKISKSGMVY